MSFKKDSGPPPRPPAPKGGSRSSSSNSLKISFKSLEEEDEEDLTTFTGEFDKKLEKDKGLKDSLKTEFKIPKSNDRQSLSRGGSDSKLSKSFDDSSINVSKIKQNLFEFSSGLKDKLAKKLEEFSSETNSSPESEIAVDDAKLLQMKKEIDSGLKVEVEQNVKVYASEGKQEVKQTGNISKDEESEIQNKKDTGKDKFENLEKETTSTPDEKKPNEEDESIDIVEDFFPDEPHEDFSGMPTVSKGSQVRKRSKLKGVFKNRPTPSASPASFSLSTLEKKTEDVDDGSIFYDAEEKAKKESDMKTKSEDKNKKVENETAPKEHTFLRFQKVAGVLLFIFLYWIIPLPSYISGFILGMVLSSIGWVTYLFLTKPAKIKPPPERVPLDQLPPMFEPEMATVKTKDGLFKGWMNEISHYNPDNYHINKTHSINIHLEDTILRLRRPKINIPKRAMWDEPFIQTPKFIHQRHYDLKDSRVFLLPPGLVKKRIWSKKYPICIALANTSLKKEDLDKEKTPDTDEGFEIITEQKCDIGVLYLFARTCREKEDWYKRFDAASKGKPLPNHLAEIQRSLNTKQQHHKRSSSNGNLKHQRHGSTDSTSSTSSSSPTHEGEYCLSNEQNTELFGKYMGRLMPKEFQTHTSSGHDNKNTDSVNVISHHYKIDCEFQLLWLNALIGRCCWDFLHQKYWADKIMDKLQKKLAKIHIPYFIEELKITNIDLGNEMPVIRRANKPYIDEDGFWVDLDVNYEGGFEMTIETKVNLMKLTENKPHKATQQQDNSKERSAITNSDEEDSAESSTDEEEDQSTAGAEEGASGGRASKKILNFLDKVTQSKYFKSATEMKYIKKAMEEVSNTPLVLAVELRYLSGTLAINIPPPPSDRFWYGFRSNPKLTLVAKPKVGARQVTVTHITEWIEKKLSIEFQRVLVMPNMDDLVVPILIPDYLSAALPTIPRSQSGSEV